MFSTGTYIERREKLKSSVGSGIIFLPGNNESAMNYTDNAYRFRQDSSFLYYFGIDQAGLAGIIDIDNNTEIIYGDELTVDEIVWMGALETIASKASKSGIKNVLPSARLADDLSKAVLQNRRIHFLPQYREANMIRMEDLLGIKHSHINKFASSELIRAVTLQRSLKSAEEIREIEDAVEIAYEMYSAIMDTIEPGAYEREIAGLIEGIALERGNGLSFPAIVSIHGEILHNHHYDNVLEEGKLLLCDSGAESLLHYASDITRTFPVSGKFTPKQREIYEIVLNANLTGIANIKPGVYYKDVHLSAAKLIAEGLKDLGFLKGSIDDIVTAGAHALFFPHGLGHLVGLDVHDLENLGENFTGYDDTVERSQQFGMRSLRFAKKLQAGYVMTVEPGIYFIPQLISKWKSENKHTEFINYDKLNDYLDFGGIRIEDDVLVTETGSRVLGTPIPKAVSEIESLIHVEF